MMINAWWTAWGNTVLRLVALVASFATMASLLIAFLPKPNDMPWWVVVLLVLALVGFAFLIILEFLSRRSRRSYAKTDTEGIKSYMHDWIEHGGRVAIWTRDMSWANNPETRKLLTEKAQRGELILCLPRCIDLASELARAGAEVCAYGAELLDSPASRFTITFFGRAGSRVAVGRADGNTHVIDEFDAGAHPAFHLAEDLVMLMRAQQKGNNNEAD